MHGLILVYTLRGQRLFRLAASFFFDAARMLLKHALISVE